MKLNVRLEKAPPRIADEDEQLVQELEQKAHVEAISKRDRIPSITEALYRTSEESMLTLGDLTGNATN